MSSGNAGQSNTPRSAAPIASEGRGRRTTWSVSVAIER